MPLPGYEVRPCATVSTRVYSFISANVAGCIRPVNILLQFIAYIEMVIAYLVVAATLAVHHF